MSASSLDRSFLASPEFAFLRKVYGVAHGSELFREHLRALAEETAIPREHLVGLRAQAAVVRAECDQFLAKFPLKDPASAGLGTHDPATGEPLPHRCSYHGLHGQATGQRCYLHASHEGPHEFLTTSGQLRQNA